MLEQLCPELEQQDQMLRLIKSSMHGRLRVDGWVRENERNKGKGKFFLIINYSDNACEVGTFTYTTALLCFTTKTLHPGGI
jgi:hypothetical protein